jgi:NhaP-type Na+/H+ or K+/H+ antiporter
VRVSLADFTTWVGLAGVLLLFMGLSSVQWRRLPVSTSLFYLGLGIVIGPSVLGWIHFDVRRAAPWFEHATEIAVLISLFAGGLKLRLPLRHAAWRPALRLAGPVMLASIAGVALAAVYGLGMEPAHGLLLGALLAPTDPVLASSVSVSEARDEDRMRYGLSGEAGLNDGLAFPFVALALTWLTRVELGSWLVDWALYRLLWAVSAALALGFAIGQGIGRISIALRSRLRDATAPSDLLALALIALAYAGAELVGAWGFLAVFAAGIGLRRAEMRVVQDSPHPDTQQERDNTDGDYVHPPAEDLVPPKLQDEAMAQPAVAAGVLVAEALTFAGTMERLVEVALVMLIGAICVTHWDPRALWIALALFVVMRPLATRLALVYTDTSPAQRWLMGWFGIRGVGSLYYLSYALTHGVSGGPASEISDLVISTVALSIVIHGVTARPLLAWYGKATAGRHV